MAFVKRISKDERELKTVHPTQLECKYIVAERDGKTLLQLNSYGSEKRDIPEKLSQTLQFDGESARQLYNILEQEFGFGEDKK